MSDLHTKQSRDRRATMSPKQRADLERLSIVVERFYVRNLRMARGLQFGFRKLEANDVENATVAFPDLRK